jgi:uncharacterized protein YukE
MSGMQMNFEQLREKGTFFCAKSSEVDSILRTLDSAKNEIMEVWQLV